MSGLSSSFVDRPRYRVIGSRCLCLAVCRLVEWAADEVMNQPNQRASELSASIVFVVVLLVVGHRHFVYGLSVEPIK